MTKKIHDLIKNALSQVAYQKCILFGSQARGDAIESSDYDILIIIKEPLSRDDKFMIASQVRAVLARNLIDADVLVRSADEVDAYRELPGSVIRHAVMEGVEL
jgi:uncharacterized protein